MRLSFSQISTYARCPREYEFGFVKKISRPLSPGESFGSSVHNALKRFGEKEIEHGELRIKNSEFRMTNEQLGLFPEVQKANSQKLTAELLQQLWHQSFIFEGYLSKTDADLARKRGEKLMEKFYEWWSREKREVIAVERGFVLKMREGAEGTKVTEVFSSAPSVTSETVTLSGRFDRVEQDGDGVRIIDFKTTKPRSQESADEDMQLSFYALAAEESFGKACTALTLLFLSEDGVTERVTHRTVADLNRARELIRSSHEGIVTGEFTPAPEAEKCRRCPYRNICDAALL